MTVLPKKDVIRVGEDEFVRSTSPRIDDRTMVLKQGDSFAVFDRRGDVRPFRERGEGLFHGGTRMLCLLQLQLADQNPLLLDSTLKQDNTLLTVDLTNPVLELEGREVPSGSIHVARTKHLWDGACREHLVFTSYLREEVVLPVSLEVDADFADLFEVRGRSRPRRGTIRAPVATPDGVMLGYDGLDGVQRTMRVSCLPRPKRVDGGCVHFDMVLPPNRRSSVWVNLECREGSGVRGAPLPHTQSYQALQEERLRLRTQAARVVTGNDSMNRLLRQSTADLHMMLTQTPEGPYPYAGIPWFSTAFGRDGIVTALQALWLDPSVARGVLGHLAAWQARTSDPVQDAEPGKILHERRGGEMAALGEIPFGAYYGSVDSTPLFVLLAGEYHARTADTASIRALWPNVEAALSWIDANARAHPDGFVSYVRRPGSGLVNQGWKDSADSIVHADGSNAEGTIALAEVQGYVFAARESAAQLAELLGHEETAARLRQDAEGLRQRFEQRFWLPSKGTYALAIDGEGEVCAVRSSNAGQVLFSGIASKERAQRTARSLMGAACYSGWGIRTLSADEAAFNPMSYHNGSVWPHDNALIGAGFARYGLKNEVLRLLGGLYEASGSFADRRMPELFCGFDRRSGEGPTLYPVACNPQSWAAGSVFMLLQSALGLQVDAPAKRVVLHDPRLPEVLDEVDVQGLEVAGSRLGLGFRRVGGDVTVHVPERAGAVDVVVLK